MSAPYVRPVGFGGGQFSHLSEASRAQAGDLSSELIATDCDTDGSPGVNGLGHPGVSATYRLTSQSTGLTFLVEQTYRLDPYDQRTRCEASETAHCVRFWPTVTWVLEKPDPEAATRDAGLEIEQRFEYDPDGMGTAAADITRDFLDLDTANGLGHAVGIGHLAKHGALEREGALRVLDAGKVDKWENWHQTGRDMVHLPGLPHAAHGSGYAGCSECVHAHWSWFGSLPHVLPASAPALAQKAACGSTTCWTLGQPQILPTSKQTVCLGWTRAATVAADWCQRAAAGWKGEGSKAPGYTGPLAWYWDASTTASTAPRIGTFLGGRTYDIGDSYWPQLPAGDRAEPGDYAGDTGAMFVVPARKLTEVDSPLKHGQVRIDVETGYDNNTDTKSSLLNGWVIPVRMSLSGDERGPFYLRVHSTGPTLINPASLHAGYDQGTPWVDGLDGSATIRALDASGSDSVSAFPVFNRPPTKGESIRFELDAAPDGVADYEAGIGTPPSGPIQEGVPGVLTVALGRDYILAVGQPYFTPRIAGANVGHLTGAKDGLKTWDAHLLPLPVGVAEGKNECLALDFTTEDVRTVGDVVPWNELTPGRAYCVQTTYSGLWISLLRVKDVDPGRSVTFTATTWSCAARPDEMAIC